MLAVYLIKVLLFQKLHMHQSLSRSAPPPDDAVNPFLKQLLTRTWDKFQTSQEFRRPFHINL